MDKLNERNQMENTDKNYLKMIVETVVKQDAGKQDKNIEDFFSVLIDAARKEYWRDSLFTSDSFITRCFNKALSRKDVSSLLRK